MFNKLKDKKIERDLNKLFKFLETADYTILKHGMLQQKWQALGEQDDYTYNLAETMWNVLDEFEKFFVKGENK